MVAGGDGRHEPRRGADEHHALDAEVEHAGPFRYQFTDAGQHQRRRRAQHGDDDGENDGELRHGWWPDMAPRRGNETQTIEDENIGAEQEEQQHPLDHARDGERQLQGHLQRLAAQIQQRHQQAGGDDAEGIEPAKKRHDDAGEAVAGRNHRQQLPDRTGDLANSRQTGERARNKQDEPHRARGAKSGIGRGIGGAGR